jgi:7-cyano-7-deazaguanine synthase in queuosine biosynthesis
LIEVGEYIVGCNGVRLKKENNAAHYIDLEYHEGRNKNVNIDLKDFGTSVYKLSKRVKDLLEIAGYIFAADRESSRGKSDNVEYHSWSRTFHIHIKVRDYKFWNRPEVQYLLNDILCFITGDKEYKFTFYQGQPDFPTNLFDNDKFALDTKKKLTIALFSGGLDSLAGIIERLETTKDKICLISHQSGQPSVKKTQNNLYEAINTLYPNRSKHYKFHCGLSHIKSIDETQRTRSFLFTAMAFAIAHTYKQDRIYVYENGITSLNFAKTQDMMNSRASRTTHPKTIALLEKFYILFGGKKIKIEHPYLFSTKTDIVKIIKKYKRVKLLDSAVSCSSTRNRPENHTHCGVCSQCIDRRFAVYSSEVEKNDENGIYSFDFLKEALEEPFVVKALNDYIRLAQNFAEENEDTFYMKRADQIAEIDEYIDGEKEGDRVKKLFDLCKNHSKDIEYSLQRMTTMYFRPFSKDKTKSFYNLILRPRTYQEKTDSEKQVSQRQLIKKYLEEEYPNFINGAADEASKIARQFVNKYHLDLMGTAKKKKITAIRIELTNIRSGKIELI